MTENKGGNLPVLRDKQTLKGIIENPDTVRAVGKIIAKSADPEQILNMLLLAASRTPALYNCTQTSVLQCLMRSAETGLAMNGREAAIIPYKTEATFIPMYQGLIKNMLLSGGVVKVESRIVRAEDKFAIEYGTKPYIKHVPAFGDTRGSVLGAYAIAFLPGENEPTFDYMSLFDLNAIRQRSRASGNGPWVTDTEEMFRKTVVRRLAKYLPQTPILEKTLEYDDEAAGLKEAIIEGIREGGKSKTENLAEKLKGKASAPAPESQEHRCVKCGGQVGADLSCPKCDAQEEPGANG